MAKDSKYGKRTSGQHGSKKETGKSVSKLQVVKGAKEFADKDLTRTPNVAEPSASYARSTSIIAEHIHKPEWKMTAVEKMDMVREGVSKKDLESLKRKTNLDYDKLSTLLSTTRATLINKKGTEHFSASLGERIVSIADLYSYGFEVFEDEAKFNNWVFRPNRALGGRQPFELLDNQFGREEVKNVIGRIDYGVYS